MKNLIKLKAIRMIAGIIALVAVIGFSFAACDNGTTSGGGTTPGGNTPGGGGNTTYSLDGYWEVSDSGYVYVIIHITGSTGVYTQFVTSSALWQSAINQGMIKVGDQALKNLTKTGERTWTGQSLRVSYNASSPDVAKGTSWGNCTITMNVNGLSFELDGSTYTKRQ
jgi:predicted small secreted protein